MVMLAMNLLAVTLVQTSMREFKLSEFKTIDSSTFYLAESCINNTVEWFENLDRPPTALPYNISKDDISHLYNGTESQQMLNKLSKYSYDCTTTSLSTKSTEANEVGEGENVGASDSYGLSGDLTPTYYYQIDSTGSGPSNSQKRIISIVSVEY